MLTFGLARRLGAGPGHALLGAAILSVSTSLGFWAVSGLETALFAMLLSWGVWLLAAERAAPWRTGVVFLLAALARIEGPVLVGAAIAARAAVRRADGLRVGAVAREHAWVAALAAGYSGYFLWRWHHYGHLFPSPIYFRRIGAAGDLFASHTAVLLANSRRAGRGRGRGTLARRAPQLDRAGPGRRRARDLRDRARVVLEDVSTMAWFDRYFVPVLPCLIAAAVATLAGAARACAGRAPRRAAVALVGGFLLVWQLANPAAKPLRLLARSRGYPLAVAARDVPTARYLEQRFGAAGRVVAGESACSATGSRARSSTSTGSRATTARCATAASLPYLRELLARQPDAVVLCCCGGAIPPSRATTPSGSSRRCRSFAPTMRARPSSGAPRRRPLMT